MRELPKHREALSEPQLLHLQRAGLLFSGSEGSSRAKARRQAFRCPVPRAAQHLAQDFPMPKEVAHKSKLQSPDSSWRKPRTFQVDSSCATERRSRPLPCHMVSIDVIACQGPRPLV